MLTYVTYKELVEDTLLACQANPVWRNCLGVVGVPRSGMLPAAVASTRLNLPLADVEYFLSTGGRFYPSRNRPDQNRYTPGKSATVLLLDDSAYEGTTLRYFFQELTRHCATQQVLILPYAVYGLEGLEHLHWKDIPKPRLFEWNWTRNLKDAMVDMDGLLCEDPPADVANDPRRYRDWLPVAPPLHLPTVEVRAVVSARVEAHRQATVEWLSRCGVRYQSLELLNTTEEERRKKSLHVPHKAFHYSQSMSALFVESCHRQAEELHRRTGKCVLCPTPPAVVYQ